MADTKLSAIASGGALAGATDKVVAVRSGTTDVLVTPVALDAIQTWTAAQTCSAAQVFSSTVAIAGVATFTGGIAVTDCDIVLSATTGTKLGTATGQKLGFWGATPVIQQLFATGASHTVDQLITVLQTLGLLKQS